MKMHGYKKAWVALGVVTALFFVVTAVDVALGRKWAEKVFERLENDPSYCGMKVTVGGKPMSLVAISDENCQTGLFIRRGMWGMTVFGTTSDGLRFEKTTDVPNPSTFYGFFRAVNGNRSESFVPSFKTMQDLERSDLFYSKYSPEQFVLAVFGILIFLPFSTVCITWQFISLFLQKRRKKRTQHPQ